MKALALFLVLSIPLSCVGEDDRYYYVGGSAGTVKFIDLCGKNTIACDDSATGWKLYAGRRFSRHVAIEIHYADLGLGSGQNVVLAPAPSGNRVNAVGSRSRAIGASGRAILPLGESRF